MNNAVTLYTLSPSHGGRESSVGIATRYVLDGPGIESQREARFFVAVHVTLRPT
jgi:hypothetical protein